MHNSLTLFAHKRAPCPLADLRLTDKPLQRLLALWQPHGVIAAMQKLKSVDKRRDDEKKVQQNLREMDASSNNGWPRSLTAAWFAPHQRPNLIPKAVDLSTAFHSLLPTKRVPSAQLLRVRQIRDTYVDAAACFVHPCAQGSVLELEGGSRRRNFGVIHSQQAPADALPIHKRPEKIYERRGGLPLRCPTLSCVACARARAAAPNPCLWLRRQQPEPHFFAADPEPYLGNSQGLLFRSGALDKVLCLWEHSQASRLELLQCQNAP